MDKLTKQLAALAVYTAFALPASAATFGGTGPSVGLQTVFNNITVGGGSSVDVTTDYLVDGSDAFWDIGGSGGAVSTLIVELASFAGDNVFGIYDLDNINNRIDMYAGSAVAGDQLTLSILANGDVVVSYFLGTSTLVGNIASEDFGFFLDSTANNRGGIFFSDSALNGDNTDHLAAYQGVGDTIQIGNFDEGIWGANEYILAWEDLDCAIGCDGDYTDFVVLIESITPVPVPAAVWLFGSGLLGLIGVARRKKV